MTFIVHPLQAYFVTDVHVKKGLSFMLSYLTLAVRTSKAYVQNKTYTV